MRFLQRSVACAAAAAAVALYAHAASTAHNVPYVKAVRSWSFGDVTRVAVETRGDYKLVTRHLASPPRLVYDLEAPKGTKGLRATNKTYPVEGPVIRRIRVARTSEGDSRIVLDLNVKVTSSVSQLVNPDRLIIEVHAKEPIPQEITRGQEITKGREAAKKIPAAPAVDTSSERGRRPAATASTGGKAPGSGSSLTAAAARRAPHGPPMPNVTSPDLFRNYHFATQYEDDEDVPRSTLVWNGVPQTPQKRSQAKASPGAPPAASSNAQPASTARGPKAPPEKNTEGRSKTDAAKVLNAKAPIANKADEDTAKPSGTTTDSGGEKDIAISPATVDRNNHSLVRVFGLKIRKVVIDPGHGGHDTGTIGPHGLTEKDLVLDVALRLGKLIEKQLGASVIFTRSTDIFIPLEQRTRIANRNTADLFISIHANSSPAAKATGVETFYFNFTNDQHSIDLATRENASSASSIYELNDLLHKAVLNAKVEESRDFAQKIQTSLSVMAERMNANSQNRGIKKAPFVVLIGATMPSILAEIGFISNPHDEKLLRKGDQRDQVAAALYKGIAAYAAELSHVQLAQTEDETTNDSSEIAERATPAKGTEGVRAKRQKALRN